MPRAAPRRQEHALRVRSRGVGWHVHSSDAGDLARHALPSLKLWDGRSSSHVVAEGPRSAPCFSPEPTMLGPAKNTAPALTSRSLFHFDRLVAASWQPRSSQTRTAPLPGRFLIRVTNTVATMAPGSPGARGSMYSTAMRRGGRRCGSARSCRPTGTTTGPAPSPSPSRRRPRRPRLWAMRGSGPTT